MHDNETATLGVSLPAETTENAGPMLCRVTVSEPVATAVTVGLCSSDSVELAVPDAATVPAGQTSVVFYATILNDSRVDGPQAVWVTARVQNWTAGSNSILVLDNENTDLVMTLPVSGYEGQVLTNGGRVSISGTLTDNLSLSLLSADTSEVQVPD
ncbi:hypothetical protein JZU48_02985, partial [bacterium]|nr:hypothetical protein [bacterium]